MSDVFPDPMLPARSRAEVLVRYLDFFRTGVVRKLGALSERELRSSRLPSGWTPLELARHLTFVERRWLEWGFEGETIAEPWGDRRDGRWYVAPDEPSAAVLAELEDREARTRAIVGRHRLDEIGRDSPRWRGGEPPNLERILLHLLQEYARHLGHLDVVVELATGETGE